MPTFSVAVAFVCVTCRVVCVTCRVVFWLFFDFHYAEFTTACMYVVFACADFPTSKVIIYSQLIGIAVELLI